MNQAEIKYSDKVAEQIKQLFTEVDNYLKSHSQEDVNVGEFKGVLRAVIPYLGIIAPNIPGGMDTLNTWREAYAKLEEEGENNYASFLYGNGAGQPRILYLNVCEEQKGECFSFEDLLRAGSGRANKLERIVAGVISIINPKRRDKIRSTDDFLRRVNDHLAKCRICFSTYDGYCKDSLI